jgi:hypothetical protein
MTKSRSIGLAVVLSFVALIIAARDPGPEQPGHQVMFGPLDEAQLRIWAARSDWSRPPQSGEAVEWRGERWQVVDAEEESLWVRPFHDNDSSDRVVPAGEARLVPLSRAVPSGEVIAYRLHAVWDK